jgi:protease I
MPDLNNTKVAILVAECFEQEELTSPREALDSAGAQTMIVSPADREVQGWNHYDKGDMFTVDVPLAEAKEEDFDALLLPGGVANPDQLRMKPEAITFIKQFFESGKPVAVICHGPWTLIDAGVVKGRKITSWPSIKQDLINAGAEWVDEECVVDSGLVSSRKPDDLPAFNEKMIEEFAEGRHRGQKAAGR